MIEVKNLYVIKGYKANIENMRGRLQGRVSSAEQVQMETEIKAIATEIDRLANQPGVVKGNVERVLQKTIVRKTSIKNALTELTRCISVIESIAKTEGIVPKIEETEEIRYKLVEVAYNLESAKMNMCLPINPNKVMPVVSTYLIAASKRVESLVGIENRKLSKKVQYQIDVLSKELAEVEDIVSKGKMVAPEDDNDYVDYIFDKVLDIFNLISVEIEGYLKNFPEVE